MFRKTVLTACIATGALAGMAAPAMADIVAGSNNGELTLTLIDQTNHYSSVSGLNINLNDVLPSVLEPQPGGIVLTFDVTSQVSALLTAGASLGTLQYNVGAFDDVQTNSGSNNNVNFGRSAAVTGTLGSSPLTPKNSAMKTAGDNHVTMASAVNTGGGHDGAVATPSDTWYADVPAWTTTVGNLFPNASASLGTTLGFYYYASAGDYTTGTTSLTFGGATVATRKAYQQNGDGANGEWLLAASGGQYLLTYSYASSSEVPLPAAAWLLLSGLTGLGVVGRRRRTVVAA